jgi:hypothetical protein
MSNIIEFPTADERELRRAVDNAAEALHAYLRDGPKLATCCRRITDKAGGDRDIYERACAALSLWCITVGNLYLALPAHGRNAGFDYYGAPAARPLKGGKTKSKPKASNS